MIDNPFIYRYISFESFVGMIQNQALTFVLPELWEDPKECSYFFEMLNATDDMYNRIIPCILYFKTYAQCWTKLSESDAMWRIYSYNNRAIQIKVATQTIEQLSDVSIVPVEYSDHIEIDFDKPAKVFLRTLAIKRLAFQHEKEIRLIKPYKFLSEDDMDQHIKAFLAIGGDEKSIEVFESIYPELPMKEKMIKINKLLNIGNEIQNTQDISFKHIPDFIAGVKVHPLAPEWYVNIVNEYCERNSIPFDGKSTLYNS